MCVRMIGTNACGNYTEVTWSINTQNYGMQENYESTQFMINIRHYRTPHKYESTEW